MSEEIFNRVSYENEKDWLELRSKGIGGSDASSIIGVNPYKSNVTLWEEKTKRRVPEDISEKPAVYYGKNAEDHIRELFKLEHQIKYEVSHTNELLVRKDKDYLRASLDGELIEKESGRKGILEIKTTTILLSLSKESWKDQVPDNYFTQLLHYFLVTGYEFAVLRARMLYPNPNGSYYIAEKEYYFEREKLQEQIDYLENQEDKFYKCIKDDVCPNLILNI